MKKEKNYTFIASSKVIRYKINPQAADILATLIYKYDYWKSRNELIYFKGRLGFYISHYDIVEEVCYKIGVVQKNLILLKKEGLIDYCRQGLGKPNVYYLDKGRINDYIEKYEHEYEEWRSSIREEKPTVIPINKLIGQKQISEYVKNTYQEIPNLSTTKNKNTNNKITNNFTNLHIDVEKLENLIYEVQNASKESDISKNISNLYDYLIIAIPEFNGFKMSQKDYDLIENIRSYTTLSSSIANRIIRNAEAISNNDKESRFGNLFVGLKEVDQDVRRKYGF